MARLKFTVTLKLPPRATDQEALSYVIDALTNWMGSYDAKDPMYELDPDSVNVRFQTPRRR